jgi:hypothetical protein
MQPASGCRGVVRRRRLRDQHPPHRCRPVRFRDNVLRPLLPPCRLDHREGRSIHARRAPVRTGKHVGVGQNVLTVNLVVELIETKRWFSLRLGIQLPLKTPDAIWCCQAHCQSPILLSVRSAPEVWVLPSTGVILFQQYRDPVRLPLRTAANCDVEDATSARCGSPPITLITIPACLGHYAGGSSQTLVSVTSLAHAAFPESQAGRHPQFHFRGLLGLHSRYGPLDCSSALGGLCRKASAHPIPLASYQIKPTTDWVVPSSTGDSRRWGALRFPGKAGRNAPAAPQHHRDEEQLGHQRHREAGRIIGFRDGQEHQQRARSRARGRAG